MHRAEYQGTLMPGTRSGALIVGTDEIALPVTATITEAVRDDGCGIRIVSDCEPAPSGLWFWIPCDAVAHCHAILDQLREI